MGVGASDGLGCARSRVCVACVNGSVGVHVDMRVDVCIRAWGAWGASCRLQKLVVALEAAEREPQLQKLLASSTMETAKLQGSS